MISENHQVASRSKCPAPEIADGTNPGPKSDVWDIGLLTLGECFPHYNFVEVNPVEMLDGQHVLDWMHSAPLKMLDASSLLATLSADLLPILAVMLDSEPAKRLSVPELLRVSCVQPSYLV